MIPFVQIENAVIDSPSINKADLAFYVALKSFRHRKSKRCFPGLERIMKKAQLTKKTANRCKQKLVALGVLDYQRGGGPKNPNHYRFILEDGTNAEIARALENLKRNNGGQKDTSSRGVKESANEGQKDTSNEGQKNTCNHMFLTKRINKKDGTADRPSPQKGVGQPVPEQDEESITEEEIAEVKKESTRIRISDDSAKRIIRARREPVKRAKEKEQE